MVTVRLLSPSCQSTAACYAFSSVRFIFRFEQQHTCSGGFCAQLIQNSQLLQQLETSLQLLYGWHILGWNSYRSFNTSRSQAESLDAINKSALTRDGLSHGLQGSTSNS